MIKKHKHIKNKTIYIVGQISSCIYKIKVDELMLHHTTNRPMYASKYIPNQGIRGFDEAFYNLFLKKKDAIDYVNQFIKKELKYHKEEFERYNKLKYSYINNKINTCTY